MNEEKRAEYIKLLDESLKRVVETFKGRAERISVFGSYLRRKDIFTDLDILIVMRTEKSFLERMKEIYSLLALPVDVDVLCYTPEEFERMKERGFFKKLMEEELILYEKGAN